MEINFRRRLVNKIVHTEVGGSTRSWMVFQASFSESLFYSKQVTQLEMIHLLEKTKRIARIITLAQHLEFSGKTL